MNKRHSLHKSERGSVSIALLISMITLVCLIALIFNTAFQASRRDQMQGPADAAATGGGTMAGRGLNDIAANNNSMAEMLAVMIAVRSTLQTAEVMSKLLPIEAIGYKVWPPTAWIGAELDAEAQVFGYLAMALKRVDSALEEGGWGLMRMLDWVNIGIKTASPVRSLTKAIDLAKRNGADRGPGALLIPGKGLGDLVVTLPVARGLKEETVDRAEDCQLKPLVTIARGILGAAGPFSLVFSFPNQWLVLEGMLAYNKGNLRGSKAASAVSGVLGFLATGPLEWPSSPPHPMLLTDDPPVNPFSTMEKEEAEMDLKKVRKYLQYLAVATGTMSKKSWIGADKFPNIAPQESLTYAEADIYNPTNWTMWSQDWRVKLAFSVVLNEKSEQVLGKIGILGTSANVIETVNTH